jgi:putative transposase
MYRTQRVLLKNHKKNKSLFEYLEGISKKSNELSNKATFFERNWITARKKLQDNLSLTTNEQYVIDCINKTLDETEMKEPKSYLSYEFLDKMFRVCKIAEYEASGLPSHTAQPSVKTVACNFKAFWAAVKEYSNNKQAFKGRPKMPKYHKDSLDTLKFSNQMCVIKHINGEHFIQFPLSKLLLPVKLPENVKLKEVKVKPFYGNFMIDICLETAETEKHSAPGKYIAAIDEGVSNIAAIVSNNGSCMVYKGNRIKSRNQWFNKRNAVYRAILSSGDNPAVKKKDKQLQMKRKLFLDDYFHKLSSRIIEWCIKNEIGVLVVGHNNHWKQKINTGKKNNQNFVNIPFDSLNRKLQYKAERAGIKFVIQEESYTSKVSFLDDDYIPTYGVDDCKFKPSGERVHRGLYRTSAGILLNADINGACNIMRKYKPTAFKKTKDFNYLNKIQVLSYESINTKM